MTVHWKLFHARVLQPIMEGTDPPSLAETGSRYGVEDGPEASNMIFAVKRRFQAALKRRLSESVASDAEVGDEMQGLMQFLSKKRQYCK